MTKIQLEKRATTYDRNKLRQAFFTAAGPAGWVTPDAVLGPAVLVVAMRATVQALSPLPQVDVASPTSQTVSVTRTRTPAARGITAPAHPGVGVAKVPEKEREYLFSLRLSSTKKEEGRISLSNRAFFLPF